jgi:hypothetical protein
VKRPGAWRGGDALIPAGIWKRRRWPGRVLRGGLTWRGRGGFAFGRWRGLGEQGNGSADQNDGCGEHDKISQGLRTWFGVGRDRETTLYHRAGDVQNRRAKLRRSTKWRGSAQKRDETILLKTRPIELFSRVFLF